jgi:nucleotide-binding universal stress UspA family protein
VPVDFSSFSGRALRHALALARKFEAEVVLLHVIEMFPIDYLVGTESVPETGADGRRRAKDDLGRLAERILGGEDVAHRCLVRLGKPFRQITDAAGELKADLIVLSTHGRTGLERAYLGSTAERVVRHAPCPVLVVRKR